MFVYYVIQLVYSSLNFGYEQYFLILNKDQDGLKRNFIDRLVITNQIETRKFCLLLTRTFSKLKTVLCKPGTKSVRLSMDTKNMAVLKKEIFRTVKLSRNRSLTLGLERSKIVKMYVTSYIDHLYPQIQVSESSQRFQFRWNTKDLNKKG